MGRARGCAEERQAVAREPVEGTGKEAHSMKNEFRYSDLEFRQDENGLGVVTGTVIRYGDVATLPWGTEEFKAGAFTGRMEDLIANRMHSAHSLSRGPEVDSP